MSDPSIKRDVIYLNCQDGNHKWKFKGGRHCGCDLTDGCSVSVYVCDWCGDCDYGQTDQQAVEDGCIYAQEIKSINLALKAHLALRHPSKDQR